MRKWHGAGGTAFMGDMSYHRKWLPSSEMIDNRGERNDSNDGERYLMET